MVPCSTITRPFLPSPQNHPHFLKGTASDPPSQVPVLPCFAFFSFNAFHFLPRWIKGKRSVEAYGTRLSVNKKLSLLYLLPCILLSPLTTSVYSAVYSVTVVTENWYISLPQCSLLTPCCTQANNVSILSFTSSSMHPDVFFSSPSLSSRYHLSLLPSLLPTLGAGPEVLNSVLTWCLSLDSSFIHSH